MSDGINQILMLLQCENIKHSYLCSVYVDFKLTVIMNNIFHIMIKKLSLIVCTLSFAVSKH